MGRHKATDKSLSTVQPAAMSRSHGGFLAVIVAALICSATVVAAATSIVHPLSVCRRSAALELFAPQDGSLGSLEEAYDALRTYEFLGVDETPDLNRATCRSVSATLGSSSSSWKEFIYALKVNKIVKRKINDEVFEDQTSKEDLYLVDAEGIFRSINALSQSDGRWRYSSNNAKSSIFAAGLALEALAGPISLSSFEIDQLLVSWSTWQIGSTKNDILKLSESIEKYDNGALYFDETRIDARQHQVEAIPTAHRDAICNKVIGIKQGDLCQKIAQKYKLTLGQLYGINPNVNRKNPFVGQRLCIQGIPGN